MKILVGAVFGIGNSINRIPLIKALKQIGAVDVLIGTTTDDFGAQDVYSYLDGSSIFKNKALFDKYDFAIMAIPFDGRWVNGIHFNAEFVLDGRTRPDPSTSGLVSWDKHEIEYQMENAFKLGYKGEIPSTSFYKTNNQKDINKIYFGVGYKKDEKGFWKVKHWGNDNFVSLAKLLLESDPNVKIYCTGDINDFNFVIKDLAKQIKNERFIFKCISLKDTFELISQCGTYIGNDTGMMHVAASMGIHCIVPFLMDRAIIKNAPYGAGHVCLDATRGDDISPLNLYNLYLLHKNKSVVQ
jgi:hypothetical protein